jgi:putative inorganic carbon (HCO3(-)) transporter
VNKGKKQTPFIPILSPPQDSSALRSVTAFIFSAAIVATLVSIAVSQILLSVTALLFIGIWLSEGRKQLAFPGLWPVAAFVATTLIALASSPDRAQGAPAIRKLILFVVVLLAANLFREIKQLFSVLFVLAATASVASLVSFYQFYQNWLNVQRVTKLHSLGTADAYGYFIFGERMTGFMSHWMTFSGEQMLILLMLTGILFFSDVASKVRWWICSGLVATSIVLSAVRGVWLGVFVAVSLLVFLRSKKWLLALPAVCLALYVALPNVVVYRFRSSFDLAKENRIYQWRTGWNMIKANPWFGVGPNRVSVAFDQYKPEGEAKPTGWHGHLHNNFLQFAAERGIPCMLAWTWLMTSFVRSLWKEGREAAEPLLQAVCLGGTACALGLVTSGMFEFNFGDSEILMLFLFLVTAPLGLVRNSEKGISAHQSKPS